LKSTNVPAGTDLNALSARIAGRVEPHGAAAGGVRAAQTLGARPQVVASPAGVAAAGSPGSPAKDRDSDRGVVPSAAMLAGSIAGLGRLTDVGL